MEWHQPLKPKQNLDLLLNNDRLPATLDLDTVDPGFSPCRKTCRL